VGCSRCSRRSITWGDISFNYTPTDASIHPHGPRGPLNPFKEKHAHDDQPVRKITQGQFSFLPELTGRGDSLQIEYGCARLRPGASSTPTIRTRATPTGNVRHARCSDLKDAAGVLMSCRTAAKPSPALHRLMPRLRARVESIAMSFIVNRP